MAIQRLSDADVHILDLERGNVRGHTMKVVIAGDSPGRGAIDVDAVRKRLDSRLHRVPELRRKLAQAPLGLANPALVDDPDFDIARHVTRAPAHELDPDGLRRLAGLLMTRPLDRRHPLWRATVVERLTGGGFAIVFKFHHALVDGMSAIKALEALVLDEQPDAAGGKAPEWAPAPPGRGELLRSAAVELSRSAGDRVQALAGALSRPRRLLEQLPRAPEAWGALRRELAPESHASPFDSAVGPEREITWVDFQLDAVKAAGKGHGEHITVNDTVLTLAAGGLRRWLMSRDAPSTPGFRFQVPVSLHHREEEGDALGNRDSFMFVQVPLDEADPVARLHAISAATRRRKQSHDAQTLDAFFKDLRLLSHSAERLAERWAASAHVFGVNVSNVPGPSGPRYVLGAPLRGLHSIAEVANRHALRVSVISASGRLSFGICTDPFVVEDLEPIVLGITEDLEALSAAG
jgi:diacylglycerol O-acyltransferase / wax synthase